MLLDNICLEVRNLTKIIGDFIRQESYDLTQEHIRYKGKKDFVTYVDQTAEKRLVSQLAKILPEASFIVEENTVEHEDRDLTWVVDPLDGTTNFVHHIPIYSISIALKQGDEIILGVVYEINSDECFYSWKGAPAYMNGNEIKVSETASMTDSLIATGFPYEDIKEMDDCMELFKKLLISTHGMRRLGSAAVDLAYVACGRFEGFYEIGLNPWDVAAGAFIVQQAGGNVSDFKGSNDYIFGKQIIAGNPHIYDNFFKMVNSHLVK